MDFCIKDLQLTAKYVQYKTNRCTLEETCGDISSMNLKQAVNKALSQL